MTLSHEKTLVLCGGLQSGGTTLISYCFLQRGDTDGVLDAPTDLLPAIDPRLARPIAWYKAKISCFRLSEIAHHYRDAGWNVRPLLVLRDLRTVWASLRKKAYGCNGITAEDPPLRLRMRRFVEDSRLYESCGAARLRYEDFIAAPSSTLKKVCVQLGLPWDEAMLTWSKPQARISDRENGNDSFWDSLSSDLHETIARYQQKLRALRIPARDLEWLEREFREFNKVNGYPQHLDNVQDETASGGDGAEPSFEVTRRYQWETRRKPLRWILSRLGWPNKKLIDQRSSRRAA